MTLLRAGRRAGFVGAALALSAWGAPAPLRAQQPAQVLERVVAIVGSRAILLSEVEEELLLLQSQGQALPADSAGRATLRLRTLERMVDDELLYQRARQDTTINVTDSEIQNAVDAQVRQVRSQFQSESDFRTQLAAAGFGTPEEYRRWLAEQQRRAAHVQRFLQNLQQQGRLRGAAVTDSEVRRAFGDAIAQAQPRPPTITFRQVVIAPQPSARARAAALLRAESALAEIRGGAELAVVARRLSDDPSTRERGGDLGWFRRGAMVPAFERVAFRLRPGQVSEIVATPFGYHIIQVDRVQPGEVKARHVLISPVITMQDRQDAREVAESVAVRLRAGADFDSLWRLFADTVEQRVVGPMPRTQLPPAYASVFEGADSGSVTPVFVLSPEDSLRTKYAVALVDDVQPERAYTYEEVREQVRQNLQRERAIREYIASLRRQTYVDIRL